MYFKLRKLASILRRGSYAATLARHRVAAGVEHEPILRQLACRSVVDIGANRGQFALVAAHCFPEAKIFSFEPLPEPARVFRSVFAGNNRVTLIEAAVGPQATRSEMHVSARDDSSSLLPISALQSTIFPGTAEVATIEVSVAPLESLVSGAQIQEPALLKLDVQGFEYEVLRGCESLLSRFRFVYCECSFVELYSGQRLAADVIEWLMARNFRIKGMFNPTYDGNGQAIQADFLFQRGEAPD
jgi:FkbM family methyltransferase